MSGKVSGARARASPSPSSTPAVCCMCGDQGLSAELFGCRVCLFRSQHKYCSDLYPKAEFDYLACNWCLREEPPAISGDLSSSSDISSPGRGRGLNVSRGAFSLNKPVKRQKLIEIHGGGATTAGRDEVSPGSGRGRQVFRGKARRYKLLEEVSH